MALLIPAVGDPREVFPAHGRAFTLPEMQAFVGGHIEALPLPGGRIAWCNEDGKRLQLPTNLPATVWLRAQLAALGRALVPGDVIVGALLVTTAAEAGEDDDAEAADDPDCGTTSDGE